VTAGTYHVVVCADSGRAVKERKEGNNCKGSKGTVTVTGSGKQVTISYVVAPLQLLLVGRVTGSASNGSCTTDLVTGGGSCVVAAGVGTVTLTAAPLLLLPFASWSGATCDGTPAANVMTFAAPASDKACTATFGP
jgi:hypothetical protein